MNRANVRLAALQQKAMAERLRRGGAGYVDADVKQIAIYLVMEDIDLEDLPPTESMALAGELGLTPDQYISAVAWLDPDHATRLKEQSSCSGH
jgi:hypothetical protein